MSTRRVVVVGGGPAGTFAAINAKTRDPDAEVVLLTREPCEPYEKPPLSKAVLLGQVAPGDAQIAGPGGVAAHGVQLTTCAACTAIDRDAHALLLADGRRLAFDALVLATGSAPRIVALLPMGMPRVHYLRTEADARALRAELTTGREMLVVGGGLIGLEVAASAALLGLKVTVLEVAPRVLARVCDQATGALVHAAHVLHGVDIRLETTLQAVATEPDGRIAALTGAGDRLVVDLVIVGTGSTPDDTLAASSGLKTSDGILVDEHCRTSDPSIFAAGDAARFPGPDGYVRLENWRHAQDQGAVAGRNAAGGNDSYTTVPSFWSEQYDLYVQGVGWPGASRMRVDRVLAGNARVMFEMTDGTVEYAMGVNAQREIAIARRLIERGVKVDPEALADARQPLAAMLKR